MVENDIIYVDKWPTKIKDGDRTIYSPTPDTCRSYGYELKTQEMIDAEEAERRQRQEEREQREQERIAREEQVEAERLLEVEGLREMYRQSTRLFCQIAGIEERDKFDSILEVQQVVTGAEGNIELSLQLTQAALAIQSAITELRRKDGDDAWERI